MFTSPIDCLIENHFFKSYETDEFFINTLAVEISSGSANSFIETDPYIKNINKLSFDETDISIDYSKYVSDVGDFSDIVAVSDTRIFVIIDNRYVRCYDYSDAWRQTGNSYDAGSTITLYAIDILSSSRAVFSYYDNTEGSSGVFALDWDESDFSAAGNAYDNGSSSLYGDISVLSSTRIVMMYGFFDFTSIFDFDGTDWSRSSFDSFSKPRCFTALSATTMVTLYSGGITTYSLSGTTWSSTGNTLSVTIGTICGVIKIDTNRIAVLNSNDNSIRIYDWDGTDWSQTGNPLTFYYYDTYQADIQVLSDTTMAIAYDGNLYHYTYNGTAWSQDSVLTSVYSGFPRIGKMSSTRIALADSGDSSITVYDWGGSSWSATGNPYSLGSSPLIIEVIGLTSSTVAVIDDDDDILMTLSFDGTDFTQPGSQLSLGSISFPCGDKIDTDTIVLIDTATGTLRSYSQSSYVWSALSDGISVDVDGNSDLTCIGDNKIAFVSSDVKLKTYIRNGGTWNEMSSTKESLNNYQHISYKSDDEIVSITNNWITMFKFV